MRFLALTGATLLVIGLAGCSAPADDTELNTPASPDAPSGGGTPADVGECGGLTTDDLTRIFGVELAGPEPSTGDSDQNGLSWTSTGCDWENDDSDLEIDLDISVAADFTDGNLACIEPGGAGEVTPVDGIGNQAWWKIDDADEAEGELRVCTDDSLVELEVDAADGSMSPDELRDKVTEAIRIVVG